MTTDPKNQQPPADPPEGDDPEKHFWEEHEKRTRGILDAWFDEKMKTVRTSRTGGRTTIPKIFADIVFGPEK